MLQKCETIESPLQPSDALVWLNALGLDAREEFVYCIFDVARRMMRLRPNEN
jgi:hypothetical protein